MTWIVELARELSPRGLCAIVDTGSVAEAKQLCKWQRGHGATETPEVISSAQLCDHNRPTYLSTMNAQKERMLKLEKKKSSQIPQKTERMRFIWNSST